jgi:hypothetical protein
MVGQPPLSTEPATLVEHGGGYRDDRAPRHQVPGPHRTRRDGRQNLGTIRSVNRDQISDTHRQHTTAQPGPGWHGTWRPRPREARMIEWQRCGGESGRVQLDSKALVMVKVLVVLHFYQNKSLYYGHSARHRGRS